ncbi:hypothetical protein QBC38DRAFT_469808 [Podospora fimiseda]|uniref:Uncharacterized protein n=1 Tax=Podospora fimiseda TaxID=252190 RepID=A0AAN7BV97_9PEZI|nr:hypothetical protein QBC38DRAFT_469808 [Podospora fimiseda]
MKPQGMARCIGSMIVCQRTTHTHTHTHTDDDVGTGYQIIILLDFSARTKKTGTCRFGPCLSLVLSLSTATLVVDFLDPLQLIEGSLASLMWWWLWWLCVWW